MSSLCYNNENADSLQTLLQKANAIKVVNQECLAYIQSRKGDNVVTQHRHTLQIKPPPTKIQKTQHDANDDDCLDLVDSTSTKNIDDVIAEWRYCGEPLQKEEIAIGKFVNLKLEGFDDLKRLNNEYCVLLEQYSRRLADTTESRRAVEVVLHNMETLQVNIGEIHGQTLDKSNPMKKRTSTKTNCNDRKRKHINDVYNELGSSMFRRSFRMSYEFFLTLYNAIKSDFLQAIEYKHHSSKGPNERIHPTICLACAFRVFAGADPLDLTFVYDISETEVHESVNHVIQAVSKCKELQINSVVDRSLKKLIKQIKKLQEQYHENGNINI